MSGTRRAGTQTGCVATGEDSAIRRARGMTVRGHQSNPGDGHEKCRDSYHDASR